MCGVLQPCCSTPKAGAWLQQSKGLERGSSTPKGSSSPKLKKMKRMSEQKKILYIAGREASYSRTHNMARAIANCGYELRTILPPDRSFKHYPGLLRQFWRLRKWPDLVVVGFYGQLLMPFVALMTRKPILYDVYISTYDTMVHDRGKARPRSPLAFLFWLVDSLSMHMADKIILETQDHIYDYAKKFHVNADKFERIFLAVDDRLIHPKKIENKNGRFLVHFHGEYAPFHGVKYIIQAANQLKDQGVQFQIIGTGITYEQDRALAESLGVDNIRFIDRVPYEELADYMSRADVCLGIFGENPRTLRVLTNKVVEALAAGCPLISAKNGPVQELLKDGESALLINRADPEALAQAILTLKQNPELRKKIAERGYQVFQRNCTQKVFQIRLKKIIEDMLHG